jgi:CRP/FNR family transcriptional regulator
MISVDQIRKYPLFEGLNEDELARLAKVITKRSFASGVYLFLPGRPGLYAYLVESGLVRMFFSTAGGEEVLFNLTGPLNTLMLPTALDDQFVLFGASTVEPTVLLSFGREDFFQLFDSSPQFARNIYLTTTVITRKLLLHTRTLTTLNLTGRLATMLLRLARKDENREDTIHLPISQEELAGWIGASRGRLNHAMKLLEQLSLIRVEGRKIVILDHPGLMRLSEEQTLEKV